MTRTQKRMAQKKYGAMMRRMFGTQGPDERTAERKYNTPIKRSEEEDKELLRQAILKEISVAMENKISQTRARHQWTLKMEK